MKKQLVTAALARTPAEEPAAPGLQEPRQGLLRSWADFWFRPSDPVSLHIVRFSAGLLFFFWLFTLAGYQADFFGTNGWFDMQARSEARKQQDQPIPEELRWSLFYPLGKSSLLTNTFCYGAMAAFLLFALGVATRLTGPLSWVFVWSFLISPATMYEGDLLLVILAFYLMLGYLLLGLWNGPRSWTAWLFGSSDGLIWKTTGRLASGAQPPAYSCSATLVLRLIQVHFAIVIVVSALHKLQYGDWWGGVAFFYPLHPPLETTAAQVKAEIATASRTFFIISLAQYAMLAWQLAFPMFAWRRSWRLLLLGGGVIGWIGSVYLYKMPLFGPIYLIACLSFVTAEEWYGVGKILGFAARLVGVRKRELAMSH